MKDITYVDDMKDITYVDDIKTFIDKQKCKKGNV